MTRKTTAHGGSRTEDGGRELLRVCSAASGCWVAGTRCCWSPSASTVWWRGGPARRRRGREAAAARSTEQRGGHGRARRRIWDPQGGGERHGTGGCWREGCPGDGGARRRPRTGMRPSATMRAWGARRRGAGPAWLPGYGQIRGGRAARGVLCSPSPH